MGFRVRVLDKNTYEHSKCRSRDYTVASGDASDATPSHSAWNVLSGFTISWLLEEQSGAGVYRDPFETCSLQSGQSTEVGRATKKPLQLTSHSVGIKGGAFPRSRPERSCPVPLSIKKTPSHRSPDMPLHRGRGRASLGRGLVSVDLTVRYSNRNYARYCSRAGQYLGRMTTQAPSLLRVHEHCSCPHSPPSVPRHTGTRRPADALAGCVSVVLFALDRDKQGKIAVDVMSSSLPPWCVPSCSITGS